MKNLNLFSRVSKSRCQIPGTAWVGLNHRQTNLLNCLCVHKVQTPEINFFNHFFTVYFFLHSIEYFSLNNILFMLFFKFKLKAFLKAFKQFIHLWTSKPKKVLKVCFYFPFLFIWSPFINQLYWPFSINWLKSQFSHFKKGFFKRFENDCDVMNSRVAFKKRAKTVKNTCCDCIVLCKQICTREKEKRENDELSSE